MGVAASIYSIANTFFMLTVAVLPLCRASDRPVAVRIALASVCLVAATVPAGGPPLWVYVRGVASEFSVTTTLLLGCIFLDQLSGRRTLTSADISVILTAVAVAGLVLYSSYLGFHSLEIYRLGYRPAGMVIALAGLSLAAWLAGRRAAALFTVVAVAAFDLGLLDSSNLWDYLIDPALAVCAWGWAIYKGVKS